MLSALLPGVREFRTPLVVGLLWAAVLWMVVGERIAASRSTTQFLDGLALGAIPSTAWLAAAALVSYLVGSLLVVRTTPFGQRGERFRDWLRYSLERLDEDHLPVRWRYRPGFRLWKRIGDSRAAWSLRGWAGAPGMGPPETPAVDEWLRNRFQGYVDEGLVPVMKAFPGGCDAPHGFAGYCTQVSVTGDQAIGLYETTYGSTLVDFFEGAVKREQSAVEVRLQMKYPDVYAEIDRRRTEGEFRLSIFWPLTFLMFALAWSWSPFCLAMLAIPPFLVRDGSDRVAEADRKLWETVMSGEVTAPILDTMDRARLDGPTLDFGERFPGLQGVLDETSP